VAAVLRRPTEEKPMPRRAALTVVALPALLAACGGAGDTDADAPDDLSQNVTQMDTSIDTATVPADNSVPAATIPEETMPPVLPDPVDTQALGNNGVVPGEGNSTGNR
jgi:hypothetical protein